MKFKIYLRLCTHFLIAVIFTFVLASLFHSQFVMAELTSVGVNIGFSDRISMSLDDLIGLYPIYGLVIALSLLIAFSITTLLLKLFKIPPSILYFMGGGLGIATALLAMHPILDTTLIAGARSTFGFICQSLAGAIGGWVFSHLRAAVQPLNN
jgi:hypothetical protein